MEGGRIERVDLFGPFFAAFGDQIAGKKLAKLARGGGFVQPKALHNPLGAQLASLVQGAEDLQPHGIGQRLQAVNQLGLIQRRQGGIGPLRTPGGKGQAQLLVGTKKQLAE